MAVGRSIAIVALVCTLAGLLMSWGSLSTGPAIAPVQLLPRPLPVQHPERSVSPESQVANGNVRLRSATRTNLGDEVRRGRSAVLPLPNCSVVFFHHLEKTGGTTVRSIFQRAAQLGQYDFFSFVNRFNKFQMQMIYHKLWHALRTPGGLHGLRLAVEIHIGGHLNHPFFLKYTMPDLLFLRQRLRASGCQCSLVTLLRHPLLQHLSWHYHFVNHRVPLCFWSNPPDCQARLALGLTCHDGPRLPPLSWAHESALSFMWRSFDLVGVTELFDEFVLALTDLVGLQSPAYRMQVVAEHTVAQQAAQRLWTNHSCATLLSGGADGAALPGGALHRLLTKRMAGSQENAANHQRRKGRSSTRGEPGMMECRGYGPCMVPGFLKSQKAQDAKYDEAACNSVSAKDILERLCSRLTMDETLYFSARRMFEERYGGSLATDVARLQILRKEGHVLEQRAEAQKRRPHSEMGRITGSMLQRNYAVSSGGGPPWRVDETSVWYMPHERARYSCENCSGDVVPEKDLIGCWPLWPQFAPDELKYRCQRTWTQDPGIDRPMDLLQGRSAVPCWQTCWIDVSSQEKHCSGPPCDAANIAANEWRKLWDQDMGRTFWPSKEGQEMKRFSEFENAHPTDFFWHIY